MFTAADARVGWGAPETGHHTFVEARQNRELEPISATSGPPNRSFVTHGVIFSLFPPSFPPSLSLLLHARQGAPASPFQSPNIPLGLRAFWHARARSGVFGVCVVRLHVGAVTSATVLVSTRAVLRRLPCSASLPSCRSLRLRPTA